MLPAPAPALRLNCNHDVPGPVPVLWVLGDPPEVEVGLDCFGPQPEELPFGVGLRAVAFEQHLLRPELGRSELVPKRPESVWRGTPRGGRQLPMMLDADRPQSTRVILVPVEMTE